MIGIESDDFRIDGRPVTVQPDPVIDRLDPATVRDMIEDVTVVKDANVPAAFREPGVFGLGQLREGDGAPFAALVVGDLFVPLADVRPAPPIGGADHVTALLADWDAAVDALRPAAAAVRDGSDRTARPWSGLRVLPPVDPRQVFQSGANYRSHVIDLSVARARDLDAHADLLAVREETAAMMDARAANDQPYVFIGLPGAICGAFDDVVLPDTGTQHDWELELAAVIGRRTYRADRATALAAVAGYTVVNDITTRDRVFRPDIPGIGTDWLAGKNAPTFLPTGPWLTPAVFVDDPADLRVTLSVNGRVMQDESTADMIFDVARIVEHISSLAPLLAGDLVLTGSPAGNGAHHGRFLRPGDVMDGSITGLGAQRTTCRAATGRAAA
jgi:2-keto-4-pentenoate hydratase/2-oxohepta-3-ene-1,7-dioic acid hydratase in catechol pathway